MGFEQRIAGIWIDRSASSVTTTASSWTHNFGLAAHRTCFEVWLGWLSFLVYWGDFWVYFSRPFLLEHFSSCPTIWFVWNKKGLLTLERVNSCVPPTIRCAWGIRGCFQLCSSCPWSLMDGCREWCQNILPKRKYAKHEIWEQNLSKVTSFFQNKISLLWKNLGIFLFLMKSVLIENVPSVKSCHSIIHLDEPMQQKSAFHSLRDSERNLVRTGLHKH